MTELGLKMTGSVLNMTGLVLNMTGSVDDYDDESNADSSADSYEYPFRQI